MSEELDRPSNGETSSRERDAANEVHEVDVLRERLARVTAELENYRKRVRREFLEQQKYAQSPLLTDLLLVVDNLRHAMDASEIASDPDEMLRGIRIISDQLRDILERHNCFEVAASGREFDPTVHEAIRQLFIPGQPTGMVVEVLQPGYQLFGRVLRPARVLVSGKHPDATES